jgi:hypothetical protein
VSTRGLADLSKNSNISLVEKITRGARHKPSQPMICYCSSLSWFTHMHASFSFSCMSIYMLSDACLSCFDSFNVEFYVFAYVNCCIYYSAIVSMAVNISSLVSTTMPNAMSTTLHRDHYCYLLYQVQYLFWLYAICYMPAVICQISYASLYVEYHMLASYYKFTLKSAYMPILVPVSACSMLDLA